MFRRPAFRRRPFIICPGIGWRRRPVFLGGCGFIGLMMFACLVLLILAR
ncbi:MAG: hypothetical protein KA314_00290 [Chloroflexi bacterium]|nr:hypothetical protein [Chloroflexota bacterium]MBP8054245.1 hypothetical protein [Chloroflexota bacterium]